MATTRRDLTYPTDHLLGVIDTFGRYYIPAAGAFIIYLVVLALLLWRPHGVFARA